jgi:hypothetical protein
MLYADTCCMYEEVYKPRHGYVFTGKCIVTDKVVSVFVPSEELYAYRQGALIQDAMPSVNKDDREFLMSGHSKEGWDIAMKGDEDYDEEEDDQGVEMA